MPPCFHLLFAAQQGGFFTRWDAPAPPGPRSVSFSHSLFKAFHRLFTSVFFNSISVFCIIVMNRATCTCSNTYRNGVCLMMDYYAHVCKNGHALVSGDRIAGQEYCEVCGAEMLDKCPSCQSVIKSGISLLVYWLRPLNTSVRRIVRNVGNPTHGPYQQSKLPHAD